MATCSKQSISIYKSGSKEHLSLQITGVCSKTNYHSSASIFSSSLISETQLQQQQNVTCFSLFLLKLRSRAFWGVLMVVMGTLYLLTNIMNMWQISKAELEYELVIGPPPKVILIMMATFTVISMVIYILETCNTITVFFRQGNTRLSITIEMVITITLVHVPIAALNFFLAKCRGMHTSIWQVVSGVVSISFIFMRIIWFAHMQGKKLKVNDKREIKQGIFMAVCALFSCSMAFQIMSWRSASISHLMTNHTHNVSILLLNISHKAKHRLPKYNFTGTGALIDEKFHRRTLQDIVASGDEGITVDYICNHTGNHSLPLECMQNNTVALKFHFVYQLKGAEPFGEVLYNYAKVYRVVNSTTTTTTNNSNNNDYNSTSRNTSRGHRIDLQTSIVSLKSGDNNDNSTSGHYNVTVYENIYSTNESYFVCEPSEMSFGGNWRLWYLSITTEDRDGIKHTYGESPWETSCSTPHPKYKPDLFVC